MAGQRGACLSYVLFVSLLMLGSCASAHAYARPLHGECHTTALKCGGYANLPDSVWDDMHGLAEQRCFQPYAAHTLHEEQSHRITGPGLLLVRMQAA